MLELTDDGVAGGEAANWQKKRMKEEFHKQKWSQLQKVEEGKKESVQRREREEPFFSIWVGGVERQSERKETRRERQKKKEREKESVKAKGD